MIYCELSGSNAVILSVMDLLEMLAAAKDADFDATQMDPITEVPTSGGDVPQAGAVIIEQGAWLGDDALSGKASVVSTNLEGCAVVLFYDTGNNLIAAGHPDGGTIDYDVLNEIGKVVTVEPEYVGCIVYATPSFVGETMAAYKTSLDSLAARWGKERICVISGFKHKNRGSMVAANMTGHIVLG